MDEKGFIMKIVNGSCASAKIFTNQVEDYAIAQIQRLCDNPVFEGSQIRIMPDVHPGYVGTIGFTATVIDKIMPNIIGIDIGCGMTMAKLKQKKIEFQKLDTVIRTNVPSGSQIRKKKHRFSENFIFEELRCMNHMNQDKALRSVGTLGGGNHFIEVDQQLDGSLCVVIHSGSRHLGKEVTEYYLKQGQRNLKSQGVDIPFELTYLEGQLKEDYMNDIQVVQRFAQLNREAILDELVKGMKWKVVESSSCIHNYIDCRGAQPIIRKGAISAQSGENVIIPINMKDGIILGEGKGNTDWNVSAPHGAGRVMKRTQIKEQYTVSAFRKEMKGIFSTCINKDTLDEAPFAYRGIDQITEDLGHTVDIKEIMKPVYNFKAGGED